MTGKRIEGCSYHYSELERKAECRKCFEIKPFDHMRPNDYARKTWPQAKEVLHICNECDRIAKKLNGKILFQSNLEKEYERSLRGGPKEVSFCECGDFFRDKSQTREKCRVCVRRERGHRSL